MGKINTEKWQKYKITDFFTSVPVSKKLTKTELVDDGIITVYSSEMSNNGTFGYTNKKPDFLISNKTPFYLIFGDHTKSMNIADLDFCVMDNVKVLKPTIDISILIIKYITTVWKKSIPELGYARHWSIAEKTDILLPTCNNGQPDWEYIIMQESEKKIENLICISESKHKVKIDKWKDFSIGELFNVVKPDVLHTKDVDENIKEIPYVVRTKFDNGIKYKVKKTKQMNPSPAGTISFGAENATFFYQDEEYVSGRDIYYIDTRKISKYACLFLVACLQTITKKYTYNYGMFPELVKKERLKLPITKDAKPDWKYMENYMKNIMDDAKAKLNILKTAT